MQNIKQKATRGLAWAAVGNWGNQITSFVVFIVLTRLLDSDAFGLVSMATVFTSFVGIFAEQGFGQAIVQRKELEDIHFDTAFWTNIGLGSGLTLLGVLLAPVVASLYREPALTPVVALLSISFLLTALISTQKAIYERQLEFRVLSTRQLWAAIAGGTAGIVSALLGAGVYALVIRSLVNGLADASLLWYLSDWRPRFRYSKRHFKELFNFGANVIGIRITNVFRTRLDDFLIGYYLGAEALGYYVVAYRLGRLVLDMVTGLIGRVAVPMFARLQGNLPKLQQAFLKVSQMVGLLTFPIFTGMIILAPDLITLFSGEKWQLSVVPMQILSIAGFTLTMQYICTYLIIAMGHPQRILRINILIAIITALAFAVAARFGIISVAISYMIVNIAFFLVYLYSAQKTLLFDLKRYFGNILWVFSVNGIMAVAVWGLVHIEPVYKMNIWLRTPVSITLGAIIYALGLFLLQRAFFKEMMGYLRSFIPQKSTVA